MDLIRHYIKGGINVDAADYDKRTALHIAAADGCLEVVRPPPLSNNLTYITPLTSPSRQQAFAASPSGTNDRYCCPRHFSFLGLNQVIPAQAAGDGLRYTVRTSSFPCAGEPWHLAGDTAVWALCKRRAGQSKGLDRCIKISRGASDQCNGISG